MKKQNRQNKPMRDGGIPWWAWLITWGIMLLGFVLDALGITAHSLGWY